MKFKKQLKTVFFVMLLFSVASDVAQSFIQKVNPEFFNWFKPYYWISLSTMICILCGICWLYLNGKMQRFFTSLQAMGKMILTNYMMQSILASFIFFNPGLGIFNTKALVLYSYSIADFLVSRQALVNGS